MALRKCMIKTCVDLLLVSPEALSGKNMGNLWKSGRYNKKLQMVKELLVDWVNNFFVHEVGWYLKSKNLAFHPLLLFDNAPGNVQDLSFFHPTIQVKCLAKNTNRSFVQLLDKGTITKWKSCYTHWILYDILIESDKGTFVSVNECQK